MINGEITSSTEILEIESEYNKHMSIIFSA